MLEGAKVANPKSSLKEADLNEAIASAVAAIRRRGNLPNEMYAPNNLATTANRNWLAVDKEMGIIHRVWRLDGAKRYKLEYISLDKLDDEYRYDGTEHSTRIPTMWTFNKGRIELFPVPDGVYAIPYRGERTSGSLSNIPDDFKDVVINGALSIISPAYIRPFERGLAEVSRYYRVVKGKKRQWKHGSIVRQHFADRWNRNVV